MELFARFRCDQGVRPFHGLRVFPRLSRGAHYGSFHVDLLRKSKGLIDLRLLWLTNVTKNTSFQDLLFRLPTLYAYKS